LVPVNVNYNPRRDFRPHQLSARVINDFLNFHVNNVTRGTSLGHAIVCADTSATRNRGLLKHTHLNPGEGLWIVPCEGVHTFFMKFALDLVYVDRAKKVKKVVRNVPPWRMSFCITAHSIIELPVGTIDETGTAPGDQLEMVKQG
jgi:uncharacterized membrane protein (UPF0127 family)